MGYSTDFSGVLTFKEELTATQLNKLNSFLGEDCRNHPEWEASAGLYYVDLELTEDFSGIKWNGAEKTYDMVDIVNMILTNMRKVIPDFNLEGKLLAQGEDIDDRWELVMEDGLAVRREVPHTGQKVTCPPL